MRKKKQNSELNKYDNNFDYFELSKLKNESFIEEIKSDNKFYKLYHSQNQIRGEFCKKIVNIPNSIFEDFIAKFKLQLKINDGKSLIDIFAYKYESPRNNSKQMKLKLITGEQFSTNLINYLKINSKNSIQSTIFFEKLIQSILLKACIFWKINKNHGNINPWNIFVVKDEKGNEEFHLGEIGIYNQDKFPFSPQKAFFNIFYKKNIEELDDIFCLGITIVYFIIGNKIFEEIMNSTIFINQNKKKLSKMKKALKKKENYDKYGEDFINLIIGMIRFQKKKRKSYKKIQDYFNTKPNKLNVIITL